VISDLVIRQETDAFRVTFEAHCQDGLVDFRWRGEITGTADGTSTFDFAAYGCSVVEIGVSRLRGATAHFLRRQRPSPVGRFSAES
jgi:hypothetical protein